MLCQWLRVGRTLTRGNVGIPMVTKRTMFWSSGEPEKFTQDKVLPYSRDEIFRIVASVDKYQEFLPWCLQSKVVKLEGKKADVLLTLGSASLKQEQKAVLSFDQPTNVDLSMIDNPSSPLKSFEMKWNLKEVAPNECHVQMTLSYDFKTSLHRMLVGPAFESFRAEIVDKFEKRCQKVLRKE